MGCAAPDPQPWIKDPAFIMLQKQLAEMNSQLASHKVELEDMKKALANSVVQTGQARTARAKLDKQQGVVDRAEQRVKQLQLSIQTRAKESQAEYMQAFRKGLDRAPSGDSDQWSLQLALSARSRAWRVEKRIADRKSVV